MTRTTFISTLTFLVLWTSCRNSNQSNKPENFTQQIDTSKSIKIGDFWATPKPTFEFYALYKSSADTLSLITCEEYVYSPFGQLKNKTDLPTSNLKNFKTQDRVDKTDVGEFEFQILTFNSSRLIFFFDNDPEASKHSNIFKGEIYDPEVKFINGIQIGMTKDNFIKTFFDNFPSELIAKYNFFVLESCVEDIKHTYSFKDNKLQSVDFKTNSYWNISY